MGGIMRRILSLCMLVVPLAGCANFSPLVSSKPVAANGSSWLIYDASRRGTLVVVKDGEITRSCAEPAPDAAYSFANSFNGSLKLPSGTEGTAAATLNATIEALAGRDNLVLLARESLFRLCEARANGDISDQRYGDIFQDVLQQVKEIAEAQKARSNAIEATARAALTAQ